MDLEGRYAQDNRSDDRDATLTNLMIDPLVASSQENARTFIKPRPGLNLALATTGAVNRGFHYWSSFSCLVYVLSNQVYTDTVGAIGSVDLSSTEMFFTEHTASTGVKYLIISNGNKAWALTSDSSAPTLINAANFTAIGTHIPQMVSLDGYLFTAKFGDNKIYNSALADPYTWPGDYIAAEMYSDNIQTICTNNNYLYAVGEQSVEYFYDGANATGTPLTRYSAAVQQFGTPSPRSVVQTEQQVLFIGQTGNGGYTIWELDGFKATDISTPVIRRHIFQAGLNLGTVSNITGYCIRVGGQKLYVLNLFNKSLVYSFDTKLWSIWTSTTNSDGTIAAFIGYWATDTKAGYAYIKDALGNIYIMGDRFYTDGASYSFTCSIVTPKYDFDSINRKFMSRLSLVGDYTGTPNYSTGAIANANNQFYISWNDDDYATASWTTPRLLTFTNDFPAITQLGSFRRRAFKVSCTPIDLFRLEGLEVDINKGTQ